MSRRPLRDVSLTPAGWQPVASEVSSSAPQQEPSPYMTTAEAAVFARKVQKDGTPNVSAFCEWARRKGLRAKSVGLWSRAEVRMAIERLGAFGIAASRRHVRSVPRRQARVTGTDEANTAAKATTGDVSDALRAQLRLTLLRVGHTDACIDAMTLEEVTAQLKDRARAESWCRKHGCRIRYRQLQFPTPVPATECRP